MDHFTMYGVEVEWNDIENLQNHSCNTTLGSRECLMLRDTSRYSGAAIHLKALSVQKYMPKMEDMLTIC